MEGYKNIREKNMYYLLFYSMRLETLDLISILVKFSENLKLIKVYGTITFDTDGFKFSTFCMLLIHKLLL